MGELEQLSVAHECRQNWLLLPKRAGVLILVHSLGQLCKGCLLSKEGRRGIRGDLEVLAWFSNSGNGGEGPGLGREKAWKEYAVTGGVF